MKITKTIKQQLLIQRWTFIILLLIVVGLLAWISQKYNVQYDWTSGQRNSISQESITLLHSLSDPVTVNVYLQDNPVLKNNVSELLNRYKKEKDNFNFKLINPDIDIELAQLDKVTRYGQVVIKYHGRIETISSLSEGVLSSSLQRLSYSKKRELTFLEGHNERKPLNSDNSDYGKFTNRLSKKSIISRSHNLLKSPLPDNTDILVIASPKEPVLAGELEHIKKYIAQGGNLFWLMDPESRKKLSGLSELSKLFGITFINGIVVDNNINLRKTLGIQHPAMIPVLDYRAHAITKNLSYNTLFPISRGLLIEKNTDWKAAIIAQSLPQSWSESNDLVDGIVFDSNSGDIAGPLAIVIALERSISDTNNTGSKITQRIIIAGDSDFIANNYIGIGANFNLGLNIIDWLSGDDDLISIDIKNAPDTKLQLSDTEIMIIGFGFFIFIPAALLFSGFYIWFTRRKQ